MITLIGMHASGALAPGLREQIVACDLLAGGARHLAAFPEAGRERLVVSANIDALLARLRDALAKGLRIVVLASGDPLWYGLGATLRRAFPPEQLRVIPAPTSAQLAFAALAEPWHDALLLSAHGRPLGPLVARLVAAPRRAAILTDDRHTPAVVAAALLEAGFADVPAAVCERLGLPEERITRGPLSAITSQRFDPLNVLVLLPDQLGLAKISASSLSQAAVLAGAVSAAGLLAPEPPAGPALSPALGDLPEGPARPFGLQDDQLEHDGLITHLEVRAVSLACLRLRPDDLVWDIGAGSGALALEAARIAYQGQVYAIERDARRAEQLRRNLERWRGQDIRAVEGLAPDGCLSWPAPDAVFIGGSGGQLDQLLRFCVERLAPGGRLVLNLVTLELLAPALELLRELGLAPEVRQVSVSRARPLRGQTYLAALNPVYIISGEKDV